MEASREVWFIEARTVAGITVLKTGEMPPATAKPRTKLTRNGLESEPLEPIEKCWVYFGELKGVPWRDLATLRNIPTESLAAHGFRELDDTTELIINALSDIERVVEGTGWSVSVEGDGCWFPRGPCGDELWVRVKDGSESFGCVIEIDKLASDYTATIGRLCRSLAERVTGLVGQLEKKTGGA